MNDKKYNKTLLISDKKKKANAEKLEKKKVKKFDEQFDDFMKETGGDAFGECKLGWNKTHLESVSGVLKNLRQISEEIEGGKRGQTVDGVDTALSLSNYLLAQAEILKEKAERCCRFAKSSLIVETKRLHRQYEFH